MLAKRIIPTVLCDGRKLVKGKRFDAWRSVGLAAQAVRIHAARFVDEVVLLDVAATKDGRGPDLALVAELSEVLFAPLAVGGGIRSVEDVKALLRAGADKVVIGTGVLETHVVREAVAVVGSQAIAVSIDVKGWQVWKRCGTQLMYHAPSVPLDPVRWALEVAEMGTGEILLQSIDRDGTMEGYDLPLIRAVSEAVNIPVIASGGCSGYEDMRQALEAGASAIAAGALFQFTECTPRGAAQYLARHGVEVRL